MNAKKPKKGRYHLGKLFGGSFSPKKSYICHCLATLLQDNNSAVVDKPDECEYIFTILYSCCCVEKRERALLFLVQCGIKESTRVHCPFIPGAVL